MNSKFSIFYFLFGITQQQQQQQNTKGKKYKNSPPVSNLGLQQVLM